LASLIKPWIVSYHLPNGRKVKKCTPGARKRRKRAKKWYGQYTDAAGTFQRIPLATDKTAAGQMLAALVRKAELRKGNISDPFEDHHHRPLAEHLAEWEASLKADGASAKHVRQTAACVRHVFDGCRFVFIADVSASRVQQYLARLRERRHALPPLDAAKDWYTKAELAAALGVKPPAIPPLVRRHRLEAVGNGKARRYSKATAEILHSLRMRGRSIKTSNLYLDAVKQFTTWLVQNRRTADNPLTHLSGGNVKVDRRHDRRSLSLEELRSVLASARQSSREFRGLAGADREILYSMACASGLRAAELANLRPTAFDLDGDLPTVTLGAEHTKNGKTAVQPLPRDIAAALSEYVAGRPADQPVWPGTWYEDAAEMLRIDLDAAGVPYVIDGPDGSLYADFHALRHSYIALLDKSGATLKEAMQLARHSDPKLTMAVYGRAQLHDLGEAVDRLPGLLDAGPARREAVQATGTDSVCTPACTEPDALREHLRLAETEIGSQGPKVSQPQPPDLQEVEAGCDRLRTPEKNSPSRIRTYNKPVNRRAIFLPKKYQNSQTFLQFYPFFACLQAQLSACENWRKTAVLPGRAGSLPAGKRKAPGGRLDHRERDDSPEPGFATSGPAPAWPAGPRRPRGPAVCSPGSGRQPACPSRCVAATRRRSGRRSRPAQPRET
jgi:integrase